MIHQQRLEFGPEDHDVFVSITNPASAGGIIEQLTAYEVNAGHLLDSAVFFKLPAGAVGHVDFWEQYDGPNDKRLVFSVSLDRCQATTVQAESRQGQAAAQEPLLHRGDAGTPKPGPVRRCSNECPPYEVDCPSGTYPACVDGYLVCLETKRGK